MFCLLTGLHHGGVTNKIKSKVYLLSNNNVSSINMLPIGRLLNVWQYVGLLPCFSFSLRGSVLYTRNPFSIPQAKHPGQTYKEETLVINWSLTTDNVNQQLLSYPRLVKYLWSGNTLLNLSSNVNTQREDTGGLMWVGPTGLGAVQWLQSEHRGGTVTNKWLTRLKFTWSCQAACWHMKSARDSRAPVWVGR